MLQRKKAPDRYHLPKASIKNLSKDCTIIKGLTQLERMETIIGTHKNGHINTSQANSLIKERCPGFFNWRIK